uniref:Nucleolar protein 4 helical domain-containing protein n=1 Tax=Knipowitschia caucasica TaxID=637954 RepID=A0AAV2M0A5_KNICA
MTTKKACVEAPKRSRSPVVLEAEMFSEFQDWCLRTYGDSGKTKTVTRRKYNKIMQTLLQNEDSDGVYVDSSHINAKFKFWVKSKGFQVGNNILGEHNKKGTPGKPVLYVPVKSTCSDGASMQENSSLKRVAVVEDFFDIIYAMHVEIGTDPGRAPKHAGQKKTYKARGPVTSDRVYPFEEAAAALGQGIIWSCQSGLLGGALLWVAFPPLLLLPVGGGGGGGAEGMREDGEQPWWAPLLPLHGHVKVASNRETPAGARSRVIAETYAFLPREAVTRFLMSCGECQKRMHINPSAAEFKENDRPTSLVPDLIDYNMPLTATYLKQMKLQCMTNTERLRDDSSMSSEDMATAEPTWITVEQPPVPEPSPPNGDHALPDAVKDEMEDEDSSDSASANGLPAPTPPELQSVGGAVPDGGASFGEVRENGVSAPLDFSTNSSSSSSEDQQPVNLSDRILPSSTSPLSTYPSDPSRAFTNKSPPYSSGSYDSVKTEAMSVDELSAARAHIMDEDDDEHDEHDDSDKINDAEGMDPERLKAFNMFVRLFVDENLDRMVPISKQPKEKIQAIMESCGRQFPEFQERSRKRIRTYLKSCRRMKKGGFEIRPTPPHLTSAMAENILAAACDSESRNAAKKMRLDVYPATEEPMCIDKSTPRDPASVAPGFTIASTPFAQDQLYANGGLTYSVRYGAVSSSQPATGTAQTNGPTDLSMKSVGPNSTSSSANGQGGGGGGASAQLSPPEVTAVRQLIAGYRESAAFLLRSADELENLILQQN